MVTTPIVSAWFGVFDVTWDGNGAEVVALHLSESPDFEPDSSTYQTTLYAPATYCVTGLRPGVQYYARFVGQRFDGMQVGVSAVSDGVQISPLVHRSER